MNTLDDLLLLPIAGARVYLLGREDQVIPLGNSYKLLELIDNADLAVFSHCGHWSMIERTADFNRLVRDFFLSLPTTPVITGDDDPACAVVMDYCTAVRGILNDDQGGPLDPPGLRMAGALQEVGASIRRDLDERKGGSRRSNSAARSDASRAV